MGGGRPSFPYEKLNYANDILLGELTNYQQKVQSSLRVATPDQKVPPPLTYVTQCNYMRCFVKLGGTFVNSSSQFLGMHNSG